MFCSGLQHDTARQPLHHRHGCSSATGSARPPGHHASPSPQITSHNCFHAPNYKTGFKLSQLISQNLPSNTSRRLIYITYTKCKLWKISQQRCTKVCMFFQPLVKCSAGQLLLHRGGDVKLGQWPVPIYTRIFFVSKGFSCTFEQ
jgi:hypothetical protein